MLTQKQTIVSQRVIDKLVDKFLRVAEFGNGEYGELNAKFLNGKVIFTASEMEKDDLS